MLLQYVEYVYKALGTVVAAIDQYVSTTAIIISRRPQLVRKAVLMQTSPGVKDVLWRI